jgi:hypothetical protein
MGLSSIITSKFYGWHRDFINVTEYLCHKCPRICSLNRNRNSVLSSSIPFLTNQHRICNKSNTTGAICGAGTAYTYGVPEFIPGSLIGFVLLDLEFSVFCFVDHCLSSWPLYCLYFIHLRLLVPPLVS